MSRSGEPWAGGTDGPSEPDRPSPVAGDEETRTRLIHELEVHEAALEVQNRELHQSRFLLEELRHRYVDLFEFAPLPYFILDADGRIQKANLTAAGLLHIERGHLLGRLLSVHIGSQHANRFRLHLQRCLHERAQASDELSVTTRDGRTVAVQVVSSPVIDTNDQVIGCRTALTDISAVKRSETQLRVLASASHVLATSTAGIESIQRAVSLVVPDLADICLLDLVDSNDHLERAAAAFTPALREDLRGNAGRTPARVHGRSAHLQVLTTGQPLVITEVSTDSLAQFDHEPLVRLSQARSLLYVPLMVRDEPRGVMTWLSIQDSRRFGQADVSTALDLAGRIATAMDSRSLQDQLRRALQDRDDLLAFVSHDLGNPLTGLFLTTENLLRTTPDHELRQGWPHLDRIRRGIQQMRRMIDDLQDVASIDAGHLVARISAYDVKDILIEAQDILRPAAQEKMITLSHVANHEELRASCDRERVIQVLSNIIGNAVKFTPEGGTVALSAAAHRGSEVVVAVKDSGPGIAPGRLPHVFERFWQADDAAHKGRGLGLFIAKGLVEAQGGMIWAESKVGEGTTFFFTLPLASPLAPPAPSEKRTTSSSTSTELPGDSSSRSRQERKVG